MKRENDIRKLSYFAMFKSVKTRYFAFHLFSIYILGHQEKSQFKNNSSNLFRRIYGIIKMWR